MRYTTDREPLDEQLHMRLTATERSQLEEAASRENHREVSTWARIALLNAVKAMGITRDDPAVQARVAALRDAASPSETPTPSTKKASTSAASKAPRSKGRSQR